MSNVLEICTDASLKTFPDGRVFTCSGAISINSTKEKYIITPDSTNNRGELLGIYLGVKIAHEEASKKEYDAINIYSDSQFAVFGLREWMINWVNHSDIHGILYGSNNKPVKNQELFKMIVTYCVLNNVKINLYLQKGHVTPNSPKSLARANEYFKKANGFLLKPEDIFKICFYNDIVDKNSRDVLDSIDESHYPRKIINKEGKVMCRYIIPKNFKDYIG